MEYMLIVMLGPNQFKKDRVISLLKAGRKINDMSSQAISHTTPLRISELSGQDKCVYPVLKRHN